MPIKRESKPRKAAELIRKIREKLQQGNLFDPHEEARKELAQEAKEQAKKKAQEADE